MRGVNLNAAEAPATSPGLVLVATNVHVPDVRPGFVARDALVARLARIERSLGAQGETPQAADGDGELSDREIAVLRLLATDLSQHEIGAELYVSFNTVKSHTRMVFRKLGVKSREDAVARGRELGLL
ncbi:LuxR C-terminal-related transcriptional regulator [Solirubrobacter ginsenosidimutans]|uniref:LuxR C-terminal-related transcriptional regulator n=1 Tax=Solirubrobacter ginsenosidimutans TaxID=490573 RepID=A0A9X3MVN8_9ACTN|nr:LuxR C-terminal-related transcriptional regulator [Solirubrobacter ginsenosidimutans]MDA0163272.1 LuxR C-terminal-related transcriptional regulator [Solirubrobacter ginsenosidimutans]